MPLYANNLLDEITSRPIEGAHVYVYTLDGSTEVSIQDELGASITQPLITGADGDYAFQAPTGLYQLVFWKNARRIYRDRAIQVGTGPVLPSEILTALGGIDGASYVGTTSGNSVQYHLDIMDITPEAQAALNAATRLLARVAEKTSIISPPIYDPIDEFTGGITGGLYEASPTYCFTDTSGTTAAAVGDLVACWKTRVGATDYDMIQATSGNRPTMQMAWGKYYLDFANGKCLYSRANVPLKCPEFLGIAASTNGTRGRGIFGLWKNTGTHHGLYCSTSTGSAEASAQGNASDGTARAWARTYSAYFSWREASDAPVSVITSLLADDGQQDILFEDSTLTSPHIGTLATSWTNGDTRTGLSIVMNGGSQSGGIGVASADASNKIFGAILLHAEPVNRDGIVSWLQGLSRPEVREGDEVLVNIGDSASDDEDGLGAASIDEPFAKFWEDTVVPAYPDHAALYRDWSNYADTFEGYGIDSDATRTNRIFAFNLARAGGMADYFLAERFERSMGWLPQITQAFIHVGGNAYVNDTDIQAHPKRKLYQLGHIARVRDVVSQRFPKCRFFLHKQYPIKANGSGGGEVWAQAVDFAQELYGDFTISNEYQHFVDNAMPTGWYGADLAHLSSTGIAEVAAEMVDPWENQPELQFPTPALITQRKIAYEENLLLNGGFEQYTSNVPNNWTAGGDAVIVGASNEMLGRGRTCKVTSAGGGAGGWLRQTVDCTAFQGQDVALVVFMGMPNTNANLGAGSLRITDNGTGNGNINSGKWMIAPYRSFDKVIPHYLFYPVSANATQLHIDLMASRTDSGYSGAGVIYVDRAILATGNIPRDFIQ